MNSRPPHGLYVDPATAVEAEDGADTLPKLRWRVIVPLLVLLAIGVHALIPQIASLSAAAGVLHQLRWWWVAAATLAQAGSYWQYGYTIHAAARVAHAQLRVRYGVLIALGASCIGVLAAGPIGFAAATVHWTRRQGMAREAALLCGWLPGIMNGSLVIVFAIISALMLMFMHLVSERQVYSFIPAAVMLVTVVGALVWTTRRASRVEWIVERTKLFWSRVRRRPADRAAAHESAARVLAIREALKHGAWHAPLGGALMSAAFDLTTVALLFIAAGHPVGPGTLFAGYGLPVAFERFPLVPGGIGLVEGGMIGLYVTLGVPTPTAVVVVLAYRILSFWLPTLIGAPCVFLLEHHTARGASAHA